MTRLFLICAVSAFYTISGHFTFDTPTSGVWKMSSAMIATGVLLVLLHLERADAIKKFVAILKAMAPKP